VRIVPCATRIIPIVGRNVSRSLSIPTSVSTNSGMGAGVGSSGLRTSKIRRMKKVDDREVVKVWAKLLHPHCYGDQFSAHRNDVCSKTCSDKVYKACLDLSCELEREKALVVKKVLKGLNREGSNHKLSEYGKNQRKRKEKASVEAIQGTMRELAEKGLSNVVLGRPAEGLHTEGLR